MALVHDLAESQVPDFTPFDNITPEEKYRLEEEAMKKLCFNIPSGDHILSLWYEHEDGKTEEAKFVRKLDKNRYPRPFTAFQ